MKILRYIEKFIYNPFKICFDDINLVKNVI